MDEIVKVPEGHFMELKAKAEGVPELERRAMVAGLMGSSASPRVHAKRDEPPAVVAKRKAKRQAQKRARRHNRKAR